MSTLTASTLEAPAATAATPALPVIDLQALRDPATQAQALRPLARTARDTGFFYLEGHGIGRDAWQGIQRRAREFFALPLADKQALAIANTRHFRGYTAVGMEITRQRPDQREQIDLGEESPEIPAGPGVPDWKGLQGPNQWPQALPGFREEVLAWQAAAHGVALELLRHFVAALQLPEGALDALVSGLPAHRIKIIHYPGSELGAAGQGVGAHKDGGLLTLLLQDEVGGLQVETPAGWVDVPPRDGAFVINIGEMLELATNGYLRANVHRVLVPRAGVQRYSIAYFLAPRLDLGQVPLLTLPPELAVLATGPQSDPDNPLFSHVGENALKGRVRSHLDVAQRFYPEHFARLQAQARAAGRELHPGAY